jgi:hypothetical protein
LEQDLSLSETHVSGKNLSSSRSFSFSLPPFDLKDLDQMVSLERVFFFQETDRILLENNFTKSSYVLKRFLAAYSSFFYKNFRFLQPVNDDNFNATWGVCFSE